MKTKKIRKDKINVVTLGCSKNLVDSENLITQLEHGQYEVDHNQDETDANVVIINTCGFIGDAKEESVDTILHFAQLKSEGMLDKVFVTGCLSERYRHELEREIPEVDAYFGTRELPALLSRFDVDYRHELIGERKPVDAKHFAYLKIAEGCTRTCAFCAIPLMRGKHESREMQDIVDEAAFLASKGVREIILISQELTFYGLDYYKERKLAELLERLVEVPGIEWIRLHYTYPGKFPKEVIDVMARHPKICNYLDMPLQHASNSVLDRMNRHTTTEEAMETIRYAREKIPGIAVRTTFLVGFPGETEEEYEELLEFVRQMKFDRVGVFEYSHEEGTRAYIMPDDVPEDVKRFRANNLMNIQREISLEMNEARIGERIRVLFDRKEGDYFIGRSEYDSPEVDNEVYVPAASSFVRVGDFAYVRITDATEYDLYGELDY
jgi:ribosomal protein S12 methylthiotransferase